MADPQIDLVKIRNAELARRGLGAAQGISDSLSPLRNELSSLWVSPALNVWDLGKGTASGLGAALTAGAGVGMSAFGAPEAGQSALDLADRMGSFAGDQFKSFSDRRFGPSGGPDISGFGPEDMTDIFNDENLGIPAFDTQIPATKIEAGEVFSSAGRKGAKPIPDRVIEGPNLGNRGTEKTVSEYSAVSPAQELFDSAFQEYINGVRGSGPDAPSPKELEDYKAEFAKATGLDVSGNADTSQALMAFGLAAMQNRAGKGFNVGRMLESLGQAGEKALPALDKARAEARANAASAGKYALEMRSSDTEKSAAAKEKAMDRNKYWVYEKGGKGSEFANFDSGQFVDLSKYELDKLNNDKDFDSKYEYINGSDRISMLKKLNEGLDLGEQWATSGERISLIGGKVDDAPPELQVLGAMANPNYKGALPTSFKLLEPAEDVVNRFVGLQKDINSGAKRFESLLGYIEGGISVPQQIIGSTVQFARNLGIEIAEPSNVAEAKRILKNLAIDEAVNILKELGKTLSDSDRKLVAQRVGEIDWGSADKDLIKKQLEDIYQLTVIKPQTNLDRAVSELKNKFGVSIPAPQDPPTEQELAAVNSSRSARGQKPLTMDDYK
jgi:hypothetical protein